MAIKFLNSIESITLPGTTTDYYIGGSGGGVASNALKIGSRTTSNTIAMELFHALNPVSLGISYSGGDALAFIDSVHSSFDSVLQFKTGGGERFRVGALNATTFQIKPAATGNDVAITDNSGNAILYSDTSTQRIGIGTTSPSTSLHVKSTLAGSGYMTIENTVHYSKLDLKSTIYTGSIVMDGTGGYASGGGLILNSGTNIRTQFLQGGVAKMIINNGNVGIGTTSPSEKLHVDGNARVTGAYYDSGNTPGTANQVLASTATGTSWIDPGTITAEAATLVVIACKNTSGATITKGTPVYQTGTVGATSTIEIAPADALISANKLPAIGLLQTDLNNNGLGNVVITGELTNFTTSPIDGVVPVTGDKIFVKSGGGLTLTKPTGEGNGIQNMGLVGKVAIGNAGSITVSSIMRANDVPNLPTGKIWVGDGNTIVSDTVFLDEPNGRMGIGTTSPTQKLTVEGNIELGTGGYIYGDTTTPRLRLSNAAGAVLSYGTSHLQNGGSLQFVTTAGTKFRINANGGGYVIGNFGIDTTIPSEKLEVSGNIKLSSIGTGNSASSYGMLFYGTTSSGTQTDQAKIHSSPWATNSNGGNLQLYTSDASNALTERMRIDGAGNVGIGTTSPTDKLDVSGNIKLVNTQDYIKFANDFVTLKRDSDNSMLFNAYAGFKFFDTQASSERMRITSAGNVGIGTTSPDYPLHVDDTVKIGDRQGTDGSLILQSQQGPNITFKSTGDILDISGTTGATNGNSIRLSDNIKKLYFNGGIGGTIAINRGNRGLMDSNVGGLEVQQQDTASSNGKSTFLSTSSLGTILRSTSYGSTGTSGDIQFQFGGGANTSEPSPTTKMIIKNSGNVGIGTTSPSEKLDVDGNILADGLGIGNNTIYSNSINLNNAGSLRIGNAEFISKSSNDMSIFQSKMVVTSAGNVGIGTTSPSEKLHVEGDIRLLDELIFGEYSTTTDRLTNQSYALTMAHSTALNFKVGTTSVFNVYGTQIRPQVNNTVDFGHSGFRWKRGYFAGNLIANSIGIGTDFPSDELTIEAESPTIRLKDISSSNYAEFYVNDFDTYLDSAGRTFIQSGGSTNVTVTSAGNVGIGTTTPSTPLHINADAPTIRLQDATSGDNHYLTGNNGELRVQSSGYITMRPGAAVSTTFLANGNVGIGTTSPSSPLHIKFNSTSTTFPTGAGDFLKVENTNTTVDTHSSISLRSGTADSFISTVYKGINIGDLVFNLDNGGVAEKMRILANGNVGIGTDSPSQKLEVDGEVLSDGYRVSAMQTAPAARNSTGTLGEIRITSNYIYVCYATNSWSRVALATSW